jgi:hypothetical protein
MHKNLELHQVDVVGAYLQGNLDGGVYMSPPDGLQIKGKEGWRLRLRKLLYGLKQAGRQWNKRLDETMGHLGFMKSQADKCCLYILCERGQVILHILVYIDNAALASQEIAHINKFKKSIVRSDTRHYSKHKKEQ